MRPLLLCLFLLIASAGSVQAQSLDDKLETARAVARVKIALAQDEALRAFTFEPTVHDGVVTLVGVVKTSGQRDRVTEVVRGLEGVRDVVNKVQIGGAGGVDLSDLPPPMPTDSATKMADPQPEPEAAPEPEKVYHTVRSGDTLGAIARRYGVSVRQVQQLNGLRGTNIRLGARLRVK